MARQWVLRDTEEEKSIKNIKTKQCYGCGGSGRVTSYFDRLPYNELCHVCYGEGCISDENEISEGVLLVRTWHTDFNIKAKRLHKFIWQGKVGEWWSQQRDIQLRRFVGA